MKTLQEVIDQQQRSRAPHDDPLTDHLMAELVRLAEEVCVLRDRLDTCDRLAAAGKSGDPSSIDGFELEAEVIEQRLARHREFFEELFSRLSRAASSAPP